MRTKTLKFTVCDPKSRSGTEIDVLFVKRETNTCPIGQLFCYIQLILNFVESYTNYLDNVKK